MQLSSFDPTHVGLTGVVQRKQHICLNGETMHPQINKGLGLFMPFIVRRFLLIDAKYSTLLSMSLVAIGQRKRYICLVGDTMQPQINKGITLLMPFMAGRFLLIETQ